MDKCEICSRNNEPVSRYVFESVTTKLELANKRLWVSTIMLSVLLVASLCFTVWRETQFETIYTEVTQETEDGGYNNYIGNDGDIHNGEADDKDEEANP